MEVKRKRTKNEKRPCSFPYWEPPAFLHQHNHMPKEPPSSTTGMGQTYPRRRTFPPPVSDREASNASEFMHRGHHPQRSSGLRPKGSPFPSSLEPVLPLFSWFLKPSSKTQKKREKRKEDNYVASERRSLFSHPSALMNVK